MGFWFDSDNSKLQESDIFKDESRVQNVKMHDLTQTSYQDEHTPWFFMLNKDNYPGKGGYIFSCVILIFIV